ncbi:MAG: alanine--tRNA ligase, partial [Bacteroidales bacterium]|nr:alanine--tRNA ligase [Bacteroidales bacterium]
MTSSEIRQKFFDFFESKGHKIVPSAPIIVKNDPTLMFTNAGMNQFKEIFIGDVKPVSNRIANSQKCLRVSGKHNDLEEVGKDGYHHTMFEMLGNWSFGDYFKKEAIDYAWEFLTKELNIPKDRLYATVFEGNKSEGLDADTESYKLWGKYLDESHIVMGNKKDNFWEMGEQGPCGPCSEIHIDLRDDIFRAQKKGKELVNKNHNLVIEIWNLVFIQYNRLADRSLLPLLQQHVDTGMGLERLAMVMQGKKSDYDTDCFTPLIKSIEEISNKSASKSKDTAIAMHVISDHIRAIAFTITDGQLPSNTGASYVIRRILRRAVRYGFTFLDLNKPFLYKLLPTLIQILGNNYPELKKQQQFIEKVIKEEETAFLKTLETGLRLLNDLIWQTKKDKKSTINGEIAFELYDTYGFPADLTQL